MKLRRAGVVAAVAAGAAAATLFGGLFREPASSAGPAPAAAARPAAAAEQLQTGFSNGDTAAIAARLQEGLRVNPDDTNGLALLGLAYQQLARETGDPAYYTKSEGVLRRALALAPKDLLATSGLGSLALSRHRFAEGLALGRRAEAISPTTTRNYGVIGDALLELGRYDQAFRAIDKLAKLRPGLAAYARVAHARELLGRVGPAIVAMKLAAAAAIGRSEPTAWTHVQLGKLHWSRGQVGAARREYRAALAVLPSYAYALDALALAEWARGNTRLALTLEERAVAAIPLPQYVAQLGDLYRFAGDRRHAREQYATIGAIEKLLRANGVKTDLETALYDADHGRASVRLARRAQAQRPSIDGDDVLAWTLARSGRCAEALTWSKHALRLGTRDALKFFHRASIESCLGHRPAARAWARRALALNPHFSILWADTARRLAR